MAEKPKPNPFAKPAAAPAKKGAPAAPAGKPKPAAPGKKMPPASPKKGC